MRANDGVWIGWPGGTEQDLEPFEDDGLDAVPGADDRRGDRGPLRGLLQRHAVAALPRPRGQAGVPPRVVGLLRRGQPAVRRARPPSSPTRARLVWVHDYQLQLVPQMLRELRPDLRIGFYLHIPFPPAELFQQLPWRRQILEGLLGADLVGFQLPGGAANFVRLVRQRVGHKTHRDLVYLPDGRTVRAAAFPISIDAARFRGARPDPEVDRAGQGDPQRARRPAQDLPRRGPARLHQGHLRPAARVRRADRRTATSTSRTRSSCRSRCRRASRSRSTGSCATRSTGWSAGSTATSAGSAGRRSATCTRPTRARRWPRSTAPPTSWWSRRTATG